MAGRIYLDHAATTPVLPAAKAAMAEALGRWANPSSPHAEGRAARAALEDARARIKAALNWEGELIFTSGATEALGLALHGRGAYETTALAVEHEALLRQAEGPQRIDVNANGGLDFESFLAWLDPHEATEFIAIQAANNETGVLQPLEKIIAQLREEWVNRRILLLADCAQTAGKLALPDADLIAVSAHKLGGPPGIGALLVRSLDLLTASGGQEWGYRRGTENLPAILGFAAALEAGDSWMDRATYLRARLEEQLEAAGTIVVAAGAPRIPTIGAYRMPGVPAAAQLIEFDLAGVAVSAGSACSSGSLKPSHVLAAMGWPELEAREVIRVSFGPTTSVDEIDHFAELWAAMFARKRAA